MYVNIIIILVLHVLVSSITSYVIVNTKYRNIANNYKSYNNEIDKILNGNKIHNINAVKNEIELPSNLITVEKNDKEVWIARLILIVVSAFYGTNFGCVKILENSLDPGIAASLRFLIAFSVFSPQLLKVIKTNPELVKGGLEIGMYNSFGYWAQSNALETSAASTVAFICSLQVVVVPLMDLLFDEKKRNVSSLIESLIPALLAVFGVACLELGGTTVPGIGDFWALLQPLLFGFAFWRVERIMKLCTKPGEAQAFTAASLSVVSVFSCIWAFTSFLLPLLNQAGGSNSEVITTAINSQISAIAGDWRIPAALLWTGIVTTAITTFGENIAMKQLNAAESTVIYSTEPLWGTAFAAVSLGETIGWNTALGALLIISACAWRSASIQVASIITTIQIAATSQAGLEEFGDNFMMNWFAFISKLFEANEDKINL